MTNVDFDPNRVVKHLLEAASVRDKARAMYETACRTAGKTPESLAGPAAWQPADDLVGMVRQGEEVAVTKSLAELGTDIGGLIELTLYGLRALQPMPNTCGCWATKTRKSTLPSTRPSISSPRSPATWMPSSAG